MATGRHIFCAQRRKVCTCVRVFLLRNARKVYCRNVRAYCPTDFNAQHRRVPEGQGPWALRAQGRVPRAEGRRPRGEGREQSAEGRMPSAEDPGPSAEGRGPWAECRGQSAEGRMPRAEGPVPSAQGQDGQVLFFNSSDFILKTEIFQN